MVKDIFTDPVINQGWRFFLSFFFFPPLSSFSGVLFQKVASQN